MNTKKIGRIQSNEVLEIPALKGLTDRSVLLLQLGHNSGVVPFAGHEEPEHLLPVFGHDEF